jgi:CheY-like chemotaxis protein
MLSGERTKRVLIVDDCADNRLLCAQLLESCGWQSCSAENGYEAIQLVMTGGSFDVLLMDIHMPHCDGIRATRELRNRGYKGIIYAFTGSSGTTIKQSGCLDGFDGCLFKPISQAEILEFIRLLNSASANGARIPAAKDSGNCPDPK